MMGGEDGGCAHFKLRYLAQLQYLTNENANHEFLHNEHGWAYFEMWAHRLSCASVYCCVSTLTDVPLSWSCTGSIVFATGANERMMSFAKGFQQ